MIKTGAFKGSGNKWLLFMGVILGLVAAALTFVYLRSAGDEGGGSGSAGTTVPVVVAAQDIAAGTQLTEEMLTVRSLDPTNVLTGAYSVPDEVVGETTIVPVIAGEQVINAKVAGEGSVATLGENPPLSLVVPEGQRAVSVPIDNVAAVGGLVRPGDSVDLVLSLFVEVNDDEGEELGTNLVAKTVMQNVKLLALDQDVTTAAVREDDDAAGVGSPANEQIKPGAGTATFLVNPVHAEVLGLASICANKYEGRLFISLRGFGDEGPVSDRATYPTDGPPPDCATLMSLEALP